MICRPFNRFPDQPGFSLIELLTVLAIIGLILALAIPATSALLARTSLQQSAQNLRGELALVKSLAIRENVNHGLQFRQYNGQWQMRLVKDGNFNGISSRDISSGKDPVVQNWRPLPLERDSRVGYPENMNNLPGAQPTTLSGSPIRFGRGKILVFTPIGNSSSGSIFLMDPTGQVFCLRISGATGRLSIWASHSGKRTWTLLDRSI